MFLQGVLGTLIVDHNGTVLDHELQVCLRSSPLQAYAPQRDFAVFLRDCSFQRHLGQARTGVQLSCASPQAIAPAIPSLLVMQDKIKDNQQNLATIIPELASMAAELVRDLDPQVRCRTGMPAPVH